MLRPGVGDLESVIIFPEYEPARIGTAQVGGFERAVYCFEKAIQILIDRDGMDREGAQEWIWYNALDTISNGPIFVFSNEEEEETDV